MTTVAELAASGSGQIVFILEISGIEECFASAGDWTAHADDDWYDEGYAVQPWLIPEGISTEQTITPLEGLLDVPGIELALADIDGGVTALIADLAARASSRLAADLTAAGATITVYDASVFPAAPERAWLGLEAVSYTGKNATQLTGCARGILGTTARAYQADESIDPPVGIMVTDGPIDIRGRPARLYCAVRTDGEPTGYGPTTCIYRGHVSLDVPDIGEGKWIIPIEHISAVLGRSVGQALPQVAVEPGYWYSGGLWPSLSSLMFTTYDIIAGQYDEWTISVAGHGTYAWYTADDLVDDVSSAYGASGADVVPYLRWSPEDPSRVELVANGPGGISIRVHIREGDPLWALGFDAGTIETAAPAIDPLVFLAQSTPRLLVVDWSEPLIYHPRVLCRESPAVLVVECAAVLGKNCFAHVGEVSGFEVSFYAGSQDALNRQAFWAADDADDLVLRHVVATATSGGMPDGLRTAAKRLTGLLAGQPEPAEWVAMGLASADVDWDSLDEAITGTPLALERVHDCVGKPTALIDILGPRLGLLGVAPRVGADGILEFVRVATPTWLDAVAIEVDSSMWSGPDASSTRTSLGADGCLNQAIIRWGRDYRDDSSPAAIDITWDDGIATRGKTRAISYDAHGLVVGSAPGLAGDRAELRAILIGWMTALHYGLYGRLAPTIEVLCTWTSRQLVPGDVVEVTHDCIVDVGGGEVGVVGKIAHVVGVRHSWSVDEPDVLRLRFPPDHRASGIAPSALGDAWVVGTLTLTCTDADVPLYAADGGNDLNAFADAFDEGDVGVLLWAHDTAVQPGGYPLSATLGGVDTTAKTLKFTADPFGGAGLPASGAVIVTWPAWDAQGAWQQLWLSICDTSYGLGAAPDPGYQWGT